MRLTRLKVENFGRHKLLDKNIDVPVLGLMGPNGSGKSTLLSAVKFLFTNELEDKNDTYVRNSFSEENGTPNVAKVTGWFRKDNKEGEIMRQIGATTKRYLKWDGETYTSASDVEAKLKEIFEADKEARSNAIFPPQGSLDKLLFGTPAERMELFSKLLLVGYMGKISTLAEKQGYALASMVRDYTSLHTEIKTQHALAEDTYAKLEGQRQRSYDWAPDKQAYESYVRLQEEAVTVVSQKKNIEIAVQDKKLAAGKISRDIAQALGKTSEDPEMTLDEMESRIKVLQEELKTAKLEHAELGRLAEVTRNLQQVQMRQLQAQEELKALPAPEGIEDIESGIERLKKEQATLEGYIRIQDELQQTHLPMVEKIRTAIQTGVVDFAMGIPAMDQALQINPKLPDIPSPEQVRVCTEFEEKAKHDVAVLTGKASALQVIINIGEGHAGSCPVCGQSTDSHSEDWSAKLAQVQAQLDIAKEKQKAAALSLQGLRNNAQLRESADARLQFMLTTQQDAIIKMQQSSRSVMPEELETVQAQLDDLAERAKQYYGLSQRRGTLLDTVAMLQGMVDAVSPEDLEASKNLAPEALTLSESRVRELQDTLRSVNLGRDDNYFIDTIANLRRDIEKSEIQIQQLQEIYSKHVQDAKTVTEQFSNRLEKLIAEHAQNSEAVLRILGENTNAYNELAGAVKQAKEHADQLQIRRNEIELQIDRDRQRQTLIAEMRTLKDVFGKKGIPQAYVQYIYENLLPVAQENLNMLGADFVIATDPEEPVTLRFMKLNSDVSGWMPQNKLSGGQKVRVSIAFLLAVQQLIIPDIAFLVLDEPSTHIDDEGIEAMKELFLSLGEQLQNTEAQVIVCDHKSELQAAFHETINLAC